MDKKNPEVPGAEAMAVTKEKIENEALEFLRNDCDPSLTKYKGYSFNYKMYNHHSPKAHMIEQLKAANQFLKQTGMTNQPEFRYPQATRRVFGQVSPGEQVRRAKKTSERKRTRAQVDVLVKYMLFKKAKFIPGKMV